MTCKDCVRNVGPYVDGELALRERNEVEAHIGQCRDCRELAEEFRNLDRLAARAAVPAVSEDEWSSVLAAATRRPATAKQVLLSAAKDWWVPLLSLAALVVLAVQLGPALFGPRTEEITPSAAQTAQHESAPLPEKFAEESANEEPAGGEILRLPEEREDPRAPRRRDAGESDGSLEPIDDER